MAKFKFFRYKLAFMRGPGLGWQNTTLAILGENCLIWVYIGNVMENSANKWPSAIKPFGLGRAKTTLAHK